MGKILNSRWAFSFGETHRLRQSEENAAAVYVVSRMIMWPLKSCTAFINIIINTKWNCAINLDKLFTHVY